MASRVVASLHRLLEQLVSLLAAPLEPHEASHPSRITQRDARPVLTFGGCGMLYPYQLGVAQYVCERFDTSNVRCAGHSAGFAAALSCASGVPVDLHWDVLQAARKRWATRLLGFCLDSEAAWAAPYVQALAPYTGCILSAADNDRLALGYTRLRFSGLTLPLLFVGHTVCTRFASLVAFVHCVTLSQRVPPFYRVPGWLNGGWGIDGAFSADFTLLPGATREQTVTVSPHNLNADICPLTRLPLAWVFSLPDGERWEQLRCAGYADARRNEELFLSKGFAQRQST